MTRIRFEKYKMGFLEVAIFIMRTEEIKIIFEVIHKTKWKIGNGKIVCNPCFVLSCREMPLARLYASFFSYLFACVYVKWNIYALLFSTWVSLSQSICYIYCGIYGKNYKASVKMCFSIMQYWLVIAVWLPEQVPLIG